MSRWTMSGRNWRDADSDAASSVGAYSRSGPRFSANNGLASEFTFVRFDR